MYTKEEVERIKSDAFEQGLEMGEEELLLRGTYIHVDDMHGGNDFFPVASRAREHWDLGVPLEEAWSMALKEGGIVL